MIFCFVLFEITGPSHFRDNEMKLMIGDMHFNNNWITLDMVSDKDRVLPSELRKLQKAQKTTRDVNVTVRLYNLTADPEERINVADDNPEIVAALTKRLDKLHATMIPANVHAQLSAGNPDNFNGVFSPGWCNSQPMNGRALRINRPDMSGVRALRSNAWILGFGICLALASALF